MMIRHDISNPYRILGLRRNPFIAEDQLSSSERVWIDRGWSQAPSPQAKQFVQFQGNKGFGKTAHLRYWQSQTGGPYYYCPPDLRRFRFPPVDKIAFWDEANRIPILLLIISLIWARLTKATIVVGTHCDRSQIAARFGFVVTTIDLPPLNEASLKSWADSKINASRLPNMDCSLHLSQEKAREMTAIAHGSWRIAADYLHIWAAEVASHASQSESTQYFTPSDIRRT